MATLHEQTVHTTAPFRATKLSAGSTRRIISYLNALRQGAREDASRQGDRLIEYYGKAPSESEKGLYADNHVSKYTNSGYSSQVNNHLLGRKSTYHKKFFTADANATPAVVHKIRSLDKDLADMSKPAPEDIHAYSGIGWDVTHHKPGDIIHTPAYISTSIDGSQALDFSTTGNVIHFHLPKGSTHGAYIDGHSIHNHEKEFLLKRNQKWRVTEVRSHKKNGKRAHLISVVPHTETVEEALTHDLKRDLPREWEPDYRSEIGKQHAGQVIPKNKHSQTRAMRYDAYVTALMQRRQKAMTDAYTERHELIEHQGSLKNTSARTHAPHLYGMTIDSHNVNKHLLTSEYPEQKESVKGVSSEIAKYSKPLKQELHVYSGISADWDISHLTEGSKLHTSAFTSTSLTPKIAYNRAGVHTHNHSSGSQHRNILHFKLPEGYNKGVHVAHISKYDDEHEYLLDKDQKWKVEKIHNHTRAIMGTPANLHTSKARVITLVPHTSSVNESYLPHTQKNAKGILQGKNLKHKLDARISSMFLTPHPKITSEEHRAKLHHYTVTSSAINNALIAKDSSYLTKNSPYSETPARYKAIKQAFSTIEPLKFEQHVYAGTGAWNPIGRKKDPVGSVFHTPAFTSTSHSLETAHKFARGGIILHFHLPTGYNRAMNMRQISEHKGEHEVLLDHGQKWKVYNIQTVDMKPFKPVKIVTVKPHVENVQEMTLSHEAAVNEAFKHDDDVMRGLFANGTVKQWHGGYDHTKKIQDKVWRYSPTASEHAEHLEKHNLIQASSEEHKLSIEKYTADSRRINHHLITSAGGKFLKPVRDVESMKAKDVTKHIKQLDEMLDKSKGLKRTGHFYSGTGPWNPVAKLKPGSIVHTPSYISTSTDVQTTGNFLTHKPNRHIIHFKLPRGYNKGAYISDDLSDVNDEKEFLLHRNQKWKYEKTTTYSKPDYWNDAKTRNIHIHTFVPHTEPINEAYEHNPRRDLERNIGIDGRKNSWKTKHHDISRARLANHETNIEDEHDDLSHLHNHFQSNTLKNEYTNTSSHITYHLLDPASTHHPDREYLDSLSHGVSQEIQRTGKPLEREHHVYSGIGRYMPVSVGQTIHMPAFTSTSIDINKAKDFAHNIYGHGAGLPMQKRTRNILHFHLPVGYNKGTYLGEHASQHPGEKEYLLDKNQKWKVHNIQDVHSHVGKDKDGNISFKKYRIISLKPHDEAVTESTYHDDSSFRSHREYGYDSEGRWNQISNPRKEKYHHHLRLAANKMDENTALQHDRFTKHFKHLDEDPTLHHHRLALTNYTNQSNHASLMNRTAIQHDKQDPAINDAHLALVHHLSHAIKTVSRPLPEETHVYSGLKWKPEFKEGDHFIQPAFTSTSLSPGTPIGHTDTFEKNLKGSDKRAAEYHVIHFKLPKGYDKGAYVGGISKYDNEQEYLLDKGQKWKVIKQVTRNKTVRTPENDGDDVTKYTTRAHTIIHTVVPVEDDK